MQEEIKSLFLHGCRSLEEGEHERAAETFQKILVLDPQHVPALNKMGVLYLYQDKLADAEEILRQALAIEPTEAMVLNNLASIYLHRDNLVEAEKMYLQALSSNPDYGPAHNNMAVIYKRRGEIGKMVKSLKKARRADLRCKDSEGDKSGKSSKWHLFIVIFLLALVFILFKFGGS